MYKIDHTQTLLKERDYWEEKQRQNYPNTKELPLIFNLSPRQVIQAKLRYHQTHKKRVISKINNLQVEELHTTNKFEECSVAQMLCYGHKILNKINTTLNYLRKQSKYLKECEVAEVNHTPPPKKEFTEYDKDFIKANTPIELLLGTPVKIMMGGKKWFLCPNHSDTNPSFLWNEDKHFGYCFTCDFSCDIIKLYQHLNGTSFVETLKLLS